MNTMYFQDVKNPANVFNARANDQTLFKLFQAMNKQGVYRYRFDEIPTWFIHYVDTNFDWKV